MFFECTVGRGKVIRQQDKLLTVAAAYVMSQNS
jgi:hypothetical protein